MIEVERKYGIVFFIRWKGALEFMEKLSRGKLGAFVEHVSPVVFLGPILGSRFGKVDVVSFLVLLALSLLVIGGPAAGVFTLLFGLLGAAFYVLGSFAVNIVLTYLAGGSPLPGIAPVIPGVQVGPYKIPFLEGWLSILLIFLIHEGAHGIAALRRKIPLVDTAAVVLGFVPLAAYVMPDEEAFKRASPEAKVKVLGAGPTANALTFLLVFPLFTLLGYALSPYFTSIYQNYALGVKVLSVPDTIEYNGEVVPSLVKGILSPGDVILSIDGYPTKTIKDVLEALKRAQGETVTIVYLHGDEVRKATIPNRGYLGVRGGEVVWKSPPPLAYHLLSFLLSFLSLFAMLSIAVAVFNALPFSVLDGGQAMEEVERVWGIRATPLKALALLLLVINALPWFF